MLATQIAQESACDSSRIVDATLKHLEGLATLPHSTMEIMRLANDSQAMVDDFRKLIDHDMSLSSGLLRVVNSSMYGLPRQVDSIEQAITLLGFNATELWTHSVAVGVGAGMLATRHRAIKPDEAYLAGILHDIGIVVEFQLLKAKFEEVIQAIVAGKQGETFRAAELRIIGATHDDFGAGLCRKWRFPMAFEQVADWHHNPLERPFTSPTCWRCGPTSDTRGPWTRPRSTAPCWTS